MLHLAGRNVLFAALLLSWSVASAAVLECPANAPSDWRVGRARLDRARVLSYLPGARVDEKALPEGTPDKEWQTGGALYQSWNMKAGAASMIYQVDCLYVGTPRFLRYEARRATRCLARRRVRREGLMAGSLEFRCR
jgi:hypothetical protein